MAYNATGCDAVVYVHSVTFADAQAMLPLGFVAADLGELLDIDVRLDRGAIALVTFTCDDHEAADGPVGVASVNVFVDPPVLNGEQTDPEGVFINAYELHRFASNDTYVASYEAFGWSAQSGIEASLAIAVREPLPTPGIDSKEPNPLIGTSSGSMDGEELWTGGILTGTTYHLQDRTSRFYHAAEGGISYDEYTIDRQGRGGTSGCTYSGVVADWMGRTQCDASENLGLGFQAFNIQGTMHHLPGVYA